MKPDFFMALWSVSYVCILGTYIRDDLYPICSNLHGSTMHVASFPALQCCTLKSLLFREQHGNRAFKAMNLAVLCGDFQTIFFLLSVASNYTPSRKFKICGSTSLYIGTQNGLKLEQGLLIHTSELKLWHFEAIDLQCFPPTHYVSACGHAHIWTWWPLPDLINIIGSLVALYGSTTA